MATPMSEREIAEALGISRARVRYHLHRALKKMAANAALRDAVEVARDSAHRNSVAESCVLFGISKVGGKKYRATPCP